MWLIYVFSTLIPQNKEDAFKSTITVIDPNKFKIQKKFDTNSDIYVSDSFYKENNIFFVASRQPNDITLSKKIYILNLVDGKVSNIDLKADCPYQIKNYKDKLLVSSYNSVNRIGNKLTVLDLNKKSTELISFEHNLIQIDVYNDYLVASDNKKKYIYDINTFKLISKFSIKEPRKNYKNQGFYIYK